MTERLLEVPTAHGPAVAHLWGGPGARLLLVLGHGAGGGVDAPDLVAVREAAVAAGHAVALVEQPYRVAGRRAPTPAHQLDAAWTAVVAELRAQWPAARVVTGGRSSGGRVALRTARACRAAAVIALAFPLRPPGRDADRTVELLEAGVPVLVVQGTRDAFGSAEAVTGVVPAGSAISVHAVAGADHSFRARRADGRTSAECTREVAAAVRGWLPVVSRG